MMGGAADATLDLVIELTRLIERHGATTVVDDATLPGRRGAVTGSGGLSLHLVVS